MSGPLWVLILDEVSPLRETSARNVLNESKLKWRWSAAQRGKRLELWLDDAASEPYRSLKEICNLYGFVIRTAAEEGIKIIPYKPMEEEVILIAVEVALRDSGAMHELIGNMIHELTWRQGLPNANHRTAFAFIAVLIENEGSESPDPGRYKGIAEDFAVASKPLIFEKEFAVGLESLRERHRVVAQQAARKILASVQSRT